MNRIHGGARADIYMAAIQELEALQVEMGTEAATVKRRQRRMHALVAGGILLVSLMSAVVAQQAMPILQRPLSMVERDAIGSLIGYVAHKSQSTEKWIETVLLAHLDAAHIADLYGDDYDRAISYLLRLSGG